MKFIYFTIYNFSIGIFLKSYGYLSFLSFTICILFHSRHTSFHCGFYFSYLKRHRIRNREMAARNEIYEPMDLGFTRQLPKTWPLHQSSQALVSITYRPALRSRRPRGNQRFGKDSSWKKRIRYTWEENNNVM